MTERGQALPLVLVAVLFAGLAMLGAARLGGVVVGRARAQAAADAAALAGASSGPGAARRVAAANGAQLQGWATPGGDVEVVVERDGTRATARARWVPVPIP